ncbi:MAG TPA: hypothetical protein VNB22_06255 [Pyrinomonadaceae bacterium]|nr:hypothetical protein [Pyrinomonadaceae bacterium]
MLKKIVLVLAFATILMAIPALAGTGCKGVKFVGSYTSTTANVDVFGDGTLFHTYVNQLTLNENGTANLYWTGYNDYFTNLGTGSPSIGSWTCRGDGKLVVNLITALYIPSTPSGNAPAPDVTLYQHYRTTYLFSIPDENTITRIQSRSRRYTPAQDPGDPNGGTLGALNNTQSTYTRVVASDADLLLP